MVIVTVALCLVQQIGARLDAVMLTTAKDTRVFEKSIASSLAHLQGVETFYVITPSPDALHKKLGKTITTGTMTMSYRL